MDNLYSCFKQRSASKKEKLYLKKRLKRLSRKLKLLYYALTLFITLLTTGSLILAITTRVYEFLLTLIMTTPLLFFIKQSKNSCVICFSDSIEKIIEIKGTFGIENIVEDDSSHQNYYIGTMKCHIPRNWLNFIKEGQFITAEALPVSFTNNNSFSECNISNQLFILVSLNNRYFIDREIAQESIKF